MRATPRLRAAVASRLIGAGPAERVVMPGRPVATLRAAPGALRVTFGAFTGRDAVIVTGTAPGLRGVPVPPRGFQVETASHPCGGEDGV